MNGMYCDDESVQELVALLELRYGRESQELKDRLNGLLAEPIDRKGTNNE